MSYIIGLTNIATLNSHKVGITKELPSFFLGSSLPLQAFK